MGTLFSKARYSLENKGSFAYGAVAETIGDSWHRCLRADLDPLGTPVEAVISHSDLNIRKDYSSRILRLARPEMELLSSQIAGANFLVAFADSEGVILDSIMDDEFRDSKPGKSIVPGSIWTEELRGTNALGLSLYSGKPSIVTGSEHFFSNHSGVSCLSAPIINSQGEVVGLIDASSEVAARQFHTHALVILAVTNVENQLFVEDHREDHIILFHPRKEYIATQSVGMLAFNAEGQITGYNLRAAAILSGIDISNHTHFNSVFQGGFDAAMSQLGNGLTINLRDWMNSSLVVKIRLTRSKTGSMSDGARKTIVPIESIFEKNISNYKGSRKFGVFDDDTLRHNLRIAIKSARHGLPILISGSSGVGKNSMAMEIHRQCHGDLPFITIDCASVTFNTIENHLVAKIKSQSGKESTGKVDFKKGGTLLLDGLETISTQAIPAIRALLNRVLTRKGPILGQGDWVVISSSAMTEDDFRTTKPIDEDLILRLVGFNLKIPGLAKRTDFAKIARFILDQISSEHQLSQSALESLQNQQWPDNLHALKRQLQIIIVHSTGLIIRSDTVEKIIGGPIQQDCKPCSRCENSPVKKQSCLNIQKTVKDCNNNIALAARQLGIARNTVYAHCNWLIAGR
ncbi:MAG: sigma-54-dependent Fis family transcriptional regulator [OCS116 cluster bacterium]|nr:sigma-54-dependent Fis family transcriptional regulator [OCS116 cluster bacterium]